MNTYIIIRDDMKVELVQYMGSDEMVARSARVSTGNDEIEQDKIKGLIEYLVKSQHSSVLEHNVVTFRLEVPLFVRDQIVRHRTFSYNIRSARYSEMKPEFYVPHNDRPIVNVGTSARPKLEKNIEKRMVSTNIHEVASEICWGMYKGLLDSGIANEVARNVLPVNLYTAMYMTGNLNNWFKFLHLRDGKYGYPQYEIVQVAKQIETILTDLFPLTMAAWQKSR